MNLIRYNNDSILVRKLTTPAENVVIMTPVYNIFFNSILNNGRNVLQSQLAYENGRYVIDFEDLEVKLKNPQTTLLILCNPQNPGGNVWRKEELARIGELAYKYGVVSFLTELDIAGITPVTNISQSSSILKLWRLSHQPVYASYQSFDISV